MTVPGSNVSGYQEPFLPKPPPSLPRPMLLIRSLQICPAHVPCDLSQLGFICVACQQSRPNHTFPHALSRVRGATCTHMCHCRPDAGKDWELALLGALRVSYCQTGKEGIEYRALDGPRLDTKGGGVFQRWWPLGKKFGPWSVPLTVTVTRCFPLPRLPWSKQLPWLCPSTILYSPPQAQSNRSQ